MVGFTGDAAPRDVFLCVVVRPKMLGIMAGLDQKDSCVEEYRNGFYGENGFTIFPFSAQCLDSSGTRYASDTEEIWTNFPQFRMRTGLQIVRWIQALLSEL